MQQQPSTSTQHHSSSSSIGAFAHRISHSSILVVLSLLRCTGAACVPVHHRAVASMSRSALSKFSSSFSHPLLQRGNASIAFRLRPRLSNCTNHAINFRSLPSRPLSLSSRITTASRASLLPSGSAPVVPSSFLVPTLWCAALWQSRVPTHSSDGSTRHPRLRPPPPRRAFRALWC